jgi:hypothetical protein
VGTQILLYNCKCSDPAFNTRDARDRLHLACHSSCVVGHLPCSVSATYITGSDLLPRALVLSPFSQVFFMSRNCAVFKVSYFDLICLCNFLHIHLWPEVKCLFSYNVKHSTAIRRELQTVTCSYFVVSLILRNTGAVSNPGTCLSAFRYIKDAAVEMLQRKVLQQFVLLLV